MNGNNKNEFLDQLADLLEKYKAGFIFTKEHDGLYAHITLEQKGVPIEVFRGFLDDTQLPNLLRKAKSILPK